MRSVKIKRWMTRVLLLSLTFLVLPAKASWEEASASIENTTQQMFGLMGSVQMRDKENFDELQGKIDGLLNNVVDFDYISKLVMGKHYRSASAEQYETFSKVFRTTLVRTYAKAMVNFDLGRYEIAPSAADSPEPDKQIVTVHVYSSSGKQYTLVYYMVKEAEARWKLVNVILDGINLRITFKNQFSDLVSQNRGDIGKAIIQWQEKMDGSNS